jgi:hypothetical protein
VLVGVGVVVDITVSGVGHLKGRGVHDILRQEK